MRNKRKCGIIIYYTMKTLWGISMLNIAVMGYGVVGSGVVRLLWQNRDLFARKTGEEIFVKYILDIRDFPDDPFSDRMTKKFDDILADDSVRVVCEVIGGCGLAYEFTRRCLAAGKSVVTSNKELVAKHAPELMELAYNKNAKYLFEASVGGGIPVLHPMRECLCANRISRVTGILNGTTNYILTKMIRENVSFEDALKEAQRLGYAEADPSADVDGKDTCRKICILASLAFGRHIDPDLVQTRGIRSVTLADVEKAEAQGYRIKLLGCAQQGENGTVHILVGPCVVRASSVLGNIEDVFNGVVVTGDAVGDVTFCGRGAGSMPTASAVAADVAEALTVPASARDVQWVRTGDDFVRPFENLPLLAGTDIPVMETGGEK